MKNLKTVTLNKPVTVSLLEAMTMVGRLNDTELVELAALLRVTYPEKFVPN